jgi:ubiquinone/menaquinone biosynthesis C-methylase UbiE
MVEAARRLFPEIDFRVGDMHGLNLADGSLAGVVAFYSVIHVRRERIDAVFAEMRRVLLPGGAALVSFHRGKGELDEDGWFDKPAHFVCTMFEPWEIGEAMRRAGLDPERTEVRAPYEFEHPTERCYVLGRRRA